MKTIIKNGKKYLRFKIGDEFTAINGKGSFNKMVEEGLAQKEYDEAKGFIYPVYSGAIIGIDGTGINGYSRISNFEGVGIKVAECGFPNMGKTKLINEACFLARHSYVLQSNDLANHFVAKLLYVSLPSKYQGSTGQASVPFYAIKGDYIEIPENHAELAEQIKKMDDLKSEIKKNSEILLENIKNTRQSILDESEKNVKKWKEQGETDKFLRFKIGDEFTAISGKGSFNKMVKEGLAQKEYDEENGFIYPVYSAAILNNHIVGYSLESNNMGVWVDGESIKVSISRNAGRAIYFKGKGLLCEKAYAFKSNNLTNPFIALSLNTFIPNFAFGTAQKNAYFNSYKNEYIEIPANHAELAVKIKKLNDLEELALKTLKDIDKVNDEIFLSTF